MYGPQAQLTPARERPNESLRSHSDPPPVFATERQRPHVWLTCSGVRAPTTGHLARGFNQRVPSGARIPTLREI